jgi:hypothetical protein
MNMTAKIAEATRTEDTAGLEIALAALELEEVLPLFPLTLPPTPLAAAKPTLFCPISKTMYALRSMESPTRYKLELLLRLPVEEGAIPKMH